MKYEQLKNFILNEMKMQEGKNYQPVMIRYLNQNRGKATKKDIQEALHNANLEHPAKYFRDSPVFGVLTDSRHVTRSNAEKTEYELLDYETFTPAQKAHITMYCDQKIKKSANPINPRIILFSAAGKKSFEHFNETITKDVISNTLPGNTILKDFDAVRVWGSIYNSQNFSKWKELKKGDILLFYHNKQYIASGILEGTEHNQELADYLWGVKDEETRKTFELIVYMHPSSVFSNDIDFQKLNKLLDYDKDFMPTRIMDFTTVNKDKTDELIKKYGSLENALKTVGFAFNTHQKPTSLDLEEIIKKFDKNRNFFNDTFVSEKNESLQIREQFLEKFPIEKIPKMKLDDYVIGKHDEQTGETNKTSFSYYTEKALKIFGRIAGRWSKVHGIYWATDANRYKWNGKFKDESEAFDEVKNEIYSMLIAAKELENDGNWQKFSDFMESQNKIVLANAKSKILCIYFPHLFLELHKKDLLNYILDEFHVENKISEPRYVLLKQVLDLKNNHLIMKNWDNIDFSHFGFHIISNNDEHEDETVGMENENTSGNYYIITQNEGSRYHDIPGVQYAYDSDKANYKNFVKSTKFIVQTKIDNQNYFVGCGKISEILTDTPRVKKNGRRITDIVAKFSEYSEFPDKKVRTEEINKKMLQFAFPKKGTGSQPPAMLPIDKDLYDEIINGEIKLEKLPEKTFDDEPLPIPTPKDVKEGIKEISEHLIIPPEKIREIITGLTSGNNIILSGPIGTGKTELARLIPEIFWKSVGDYNANMFTATADWNTQDVIGGIVPKMNGDKVTYKVQDGCVTESVRKNWNGTQRTYSSENGKSFRGVWTIIDEFNRADIDKAFGQLFTALRTKDLKAPTDKLDNYEKIKMPQDYRIIGTLNTADKHHLFQLSDALKSRFLVIEIDLPEISKKDEEIYYATKNALKHFSIESNSIVSFKNNKVMKKDQNFYDLLYQAYNFLSFVRLFKKLGTAILKTVYQNLIAGYQMKYNLKEVLDNSINSVIIPQLEGLPEMELSLINNFQKNDLDIFFKKLNKSRNKRTVSKGVLEKTINFLKIPEKDFKDFETTEIKDQTVWNKLKIDATKQKSEDKIPTDMKQVSRSLDLLIEQSVI